MFDIKKWVAKVTTALSNLNTIYTIVHSTSGVFTLNRSTGFYKDVTITVPSGYTLVGAVGFSSAHNQAVGIGGCIKYSNSVIRVSGRNHATATDFTDMTVTVDALCVKTPIV